MAVLVLMPCHCWKHQHSSWGGIIASEGSTQTCMLDAFRMHAQGNPWQRLCAGLRAVLQLPAVRALLQLGQVVASLLFVVLYVWSTYSTPQPGSLRHSLDILLCGIFAAEFVARLLVRAFCLLARICALCACRKSVAACLLQP